MEINLEAISYLATSNSLKEAQEELAGAKPVLDDRTSRSLTMDQFESRIKELKKLVKDYKELLENDATAFREIADVFSEADRKAAEEYLKGQKTGGKSSGGYSDRGGGIR